MPGKSRREMLEEMLAECPDDAEMRYSVAMEYASGGDLEGAVHGFRETFARSPDYAPAYHQAGMVLVRLNQPEEARDVLGKGIAAARRIGNQHAADEMQGLLDTLE